MAMRWLRSRRIRDQELDEEIRAHFQMAVRDRVESGESDREAQASANREFGNIGLVKEVTREMWGTSFSDDLMRYLRYAARNLRRNPGFAVLAVLIMALGIGANTAVFSVVNAVLLKPLSYRDPDRIVTLSNLAISRDAPTALSKQVSIPDFQDWRAQSRSFEAIAQYSSRERAVILGSAAEYVRVTSVSSDFFRVFGAELALGRFFSADETKQNAGGAALISYAYWQGHFGGNPRILGQTVRSPETRPIVGVLSPAFRFPDNTDIWVSAVGPPGSRGGQNVLAIGRLKTGVSLEKAQAEMTAISRRLEQQFPETNKGRSVSIARLRDEMVSNIRVMLYLLLSAVTVVLLIACANTATLLLGRAVSRSREIAVRCALGASRKRIVRQLITESLLMALVAGLLGLILAYLGSKILVGLAPEDLPRLSEAGIDRWVLGFTFLISVITSLLFGLVPALYASKIELSDALKQGGTRIAIGSRVTGIRGFLVVAEVALAVMLVATAGLLIKSFVALHNVALGFQPEHVLVMRATVPTPQSAGIERTRQFFRDTLAQAATVPGVLAAGATMAPPGHVDSVGAYLLDRLPAQPDWSRAPGAILRLWRPEHSALSEFH